MRTVHAFVNESSHSSWTELLGELGGQKNTNFEEIQSLFNITQKLILEHSEAFLNVNTIEDEISIVPRSSDPVDKSKSTCLLRFRSMLGKDE